MDQATNDEVMHRWDFLRLAAMGGAGLGLASLAGCGSKSNVAEKARQGYVVAVTHGLKDSTRVMLALVTASKLPKGDNHLWFAIDGGEICKTGQAERISSPLFTKQGNAAQVIEAVRGQGTSLHIWPSCADYYGVKGADALPGLDEKGPDWLLDKIATHHLVWL
jgi:hypothetical protein